MPALAEIVEQSVVEAVLARDDSLVIRRPDWVQVVTPGVPTPIFNKVVRSVVREGEDADAAVAQALALYAEHSLPVVWWLFPSARPLDIARRLEAHGMTAQNVGLGLLGAVDAVDAVAPPVPDDVRVERVTPATLDVYDAMACAGWGQHHDPLRDYVERVVRGEREDHEYVVAFCRGEPAGAAGTRFTRESGYLVSAAVRPELRGRGVYRAMIAHRLARIRERGLAWATMVANPDTSAPVCKRLGFEVACEVRVLGRGL